MFLWAKFMSVLKFSLIADWSLDFQFKLDVEQQSENQFKFAAIKDSRIKTVNFLAVT